jgi:CheY-like chemotaxis protein
MFGVNYMTQILVVDDSRLSRRMVVDALQQTEHDITEAANGAEALEKMVGQTAEVG